MNQSGARKTWRARHGIALGIVAFLCGAVVLAPAWLVGAGVQRLTDIPIRFGNTAGTVWNGAADLYLVRNTAADPLGRIQWSLRPIRLLRGEIAARLALRHGATRADGTAALRGNTLTLGTLTGSVVLASYRPIIQEWMPLVPEGTVQLAASKLVLNNGVPDGQLALSLTDIALPTLAPRPLGSYAVDLRFGDKAVSTTLRTLRGGLQLSGNGQWQAFDGGRYDVTLTARNATGIALIDNLMMGAGLQAGSPTRFQGVRRLK